MKAPPEAGTGSDAQIEHRYGRGKFVAHPDYIEYMHYIVHDPHFAGMPGAMSKGGRINWQVSSGKTTSFYVDYLARWKWWERKADALGLPGVGNAMDRFSIAARRIHPSGYRPCRLCGKPKNVGYFYINQVLASRLNLATGQGGFTKGQSITEIDPLLGTAGKELLRHLFPERSEYFRRHGVSPRAFEESNFIRSRWLSPGYMANPPDRLDGFHDYCIHCRAGNDPGRSDYNMRTYQHDRRAFQWWAEGDWALADALYNLAGPGCCGICGKAVDRVSPDHVGPLACGFKQMPLFVPTCGSCNSTKNRRMSRADVERLVKYEESNGSVASWQVRGLWDRNKLGAQTDGDAEELSAQMRALQDCYLRCLNTMLLAGYATCLASLLSPRYAFSSHEFVNLNPGELTFAAVRSTQVTSSFRKSLASRIVRIAFDELRIYAQKGTTSRKLRSTFSDVCVGLTANILKFAKSTGPFPFADEWNRAVNSGLGPEASEAAIAPLLQLPPANLRPIGPLIKYMTEQFYRAGNASLSRI